METSEKLALHGLSCYALTRLEPGQKQRGRHATSILLHRCQHIMNRQPTRIKNVSSSQLISSVEVACIAEDAECFL